MYIRITVHWAKKDGERMRRVRGEAAPAWLRREFPYTSPQPLQRLLACGEAGGRPEHGSPKSERMAPGLSVHIVEATPNDTTHALDSVPLREAVPTQKACPWVAGSGGMNDCSPGARQGAIPGAAPCARPRAYEPYSGCPAASRPGAVTLPVRWAVQVVPGKGARALECPEVTGS